MGKWHLITDLSFLEGSSVNDGIDANACYFNYIAVQEVAQRAIAIGKGSLLAEIDIKYTY